MASRPPTGDQHHTRDGVPFCSVCARPGAHAEIWCSVAEGLVCDSCCARLRDYDPSALVQALTNADVALSPDEVARACAECAIQSGDSFHGADPPLLS